MTMYCTPRSWIIPYHLTSGMNYWLHFEPSWIIQLLVSFWIQFGTVHTRFLLQLQPAQSDHTIIHQVNLQRISIMLLQEISILPQGRSKNWLYNVNHLLLIIQKITAWQTNNNWDQQNKSGFLTGLRPGFYFFSKLQGCKRFSRGWIIGCILNLPG